MLMLISETQKFHTLQNFEENVSLSLPEMCLYDLFGSELRVLQTETD